MTWDFEHPEFPEPVICMFYNPDFIIYSSLGSFYIPCLIMVVLYTRIFKVSRSLSLDHISSLRLSTPGPSRSLARGCLWGVCPPPRQFSPQLCVVR